MVAFTAVLANSNVTVNESTKKTIVKFDDIVLVRNHSLMYNVHT